MERYPIRPFPRWVNDLNLGLLISVLQSKMGSITEAAKVSQLGKGTIIMVYMILLLWYQLSGSYVVGSTVRNTVRAIVMYRSTL